MPRRADDARHVSPGGLDRRGGGDPGRPRTVVTGAANDLADGGRGRRSDATITAHQHASAAAAARPVRSPAAEAPPGGPDREFAADECGRPRPGRQHWREPSRAPRAHDGGAGVGRSSTGGRGPCTGGRRPPTSGRGGSTRGRGGSTRGREGGRGRSTGGRAGRRAEVARRRAHRAASAGRSPVERPVRHVHGAFGLRRRELTRAGRLCSARGDERRRAHDHGALAPRRPTAALVPARRLGALGSAIQRRGSSRALAVFRGPGAIGPSSRRRSARAVSVHELETSRSLLYSRRGARRSLPMAAR